jgi:hypothetical protein
MADILATGVPTVIAASRRPIEQVWTPPLVEHRCRSGGSLPYVSACLGLLIYCDIGLCLLIGVGLRLLHIVVAVKL